MSSPTDKPTDQPQPQSVEPAAGNPASPPKAPTTLAGRRFVPSERLRAQDKFLLDLARLRVRLEYILPSWILTGTDYGVDAVRKVRRPDAPAGSVSGLMVDRQHKERSYHYERLAIDLNLFVPAPVEEQPDARQVGANAIYRHVERSDDPAWKVIHDLWLALDSNNQVMPSTSSDANHLSRDVDKLDPRI